jgi:MFS family permease
MFEQWFARRGLYYGWVVIGVCFLTLFLVLGLRFAFGVFYVAILEDTGWTRAQTAGIFSISMGVYASSIILTGALFDHFGPRRLFPVGVVLLSVGLLLCSTITTRGEFYLYYGVLVGFAYATLGFPTHMAVVPRWFVRKRGLASAVALSGVGAGSLLFTLFAERMVVSVGWRQTYVLCALAIPAVLVPLILLVHRDSPQRLGLQPDGATGPAPEVPAAGPDSFTVRSAMRSPAYWLLFVVVSMMGFCSMTMVVHQTRLSLDLGYNLATASLLFGLTGVTRAAGQLTWGSLSDRFGRTPIFLVITLMGLLGIGCLLLARSAPDFVYLLGFTVLFGFGYMGLSPVYASTVADLFPGRHLGKILGALDIGFGIGATLGPWLAGYLFDRFGNYNYTLALLALAVLVTGVAMTLTMRVRPRPAT